MIKVEKQPSHELQGLLDTYLRPCLPIISVRSFLIRQQQSSDFDLNFLSITTMSDLRILMISSTYTIQANKSTWVWLEGHWAESEMRKGETWRNKQSHIPKYRSYSQSYSLWPYQHLSGQDRLGELVIQRWSDHFSTFTSVLHRNELNWCVLGILLLYYA